MAEAKNSIRVLKPFKFSMADGTILDFETIDKKRADGHIERQSREYTDVPAEVLNHPWIAHGKADGHIEGEVTKDKVTGKPVNTAVMAGSAAVTMAAQAKANTDKELQAKIDAAVSVAVAAALAQAKATK